MEVEVPRDTGQDAPRFLASQGLTIEVRDRRGPLFVAGAEAAGKTLRLPIVGKLRDVELARRTALLRLALS